MSIEFKQQQSQGFLAYRPKRPNLRYRWALIILILSIPLLYLIYQILTTYLFSSFTGYVSFNVINIRAPKTGYVKTIYVKKNDILPKNSLLLQFQVPDVDMQLKNLLHEKTLLTTMFEKIQLDSTVLNKKMLDAAEENIKNTKMVFDKFKQFSEKGYLLVLQLEEARKNYYMAQEDYANIQKNSLDKKMTIEVNYQQKLREIESKINELKEMKKHFKISTTEPVTVMRLTAYENEYIPAGKSLMLLITNKNLRITAYIDPKFVEKVHKGNAVYVQFPNGETSEGYIAADPEYAEKTPLSEISPLATRQNKLVVIININKGIAKQYQIHGIPVKIRLKSIVF